MSIEIIHLKPVLYSGGGGGGVPELFYIFCDLFENDETGEESLWKRRKRTS